MHQLITVTTGRWKENCYIVHDTDHVAAVIDPGEDTGEILSVLQGRQLQVAAIINTHAHYDHMASVSEIKNAYKAPFYLHSGDAKLLSQANFYRMLFKGQRQIHVPTVDGDLAHMQNLEIGRMRIQILPTPGHTDGGVSFLIENDLFTGDNIIGKKIGRVDLPGGNKQLLEKSVKQILSLAPEIRVLPGHGPPVLIGELLQNMSLQLLPESEA